METIQETQIQSEDPLESHTIQEKITHIIGSNQTISQILHRYKKYLCKQAPGSKFAQGRVKILEKQERQNELFQYKTNGYPFPGRTYDPLHGEYLRRLRQKKEHEAQGLQNNKNISYQMAASQGVSIMQQGSQDPTPQQQS